ncbi:hypothetical protein ACSBR2_029590 [Camellia fascicularis]
MATVGPYLAEVYVMRKLHKEKMKRTEKEREEKEVIADHQGKVSCGCFPRMFKKIHPNTVAPPPDSIVREAEKWNHKIVD